ncbi:hypothetical protein Tco_1530171 [Tanacetum coccineum]
MATMAENVIAASAENRPPMLENNMYDRWNTRIWLYIKGKKNGQMLLDSINDGHFQLKAEITVKGADGITDERRAQTVETLSPKEKLRYNSDIKAVNILLLGFPVDIYTLINHYQTAKEIGDRLGESIHSYYLRYAKLINDMNIIKMSMSNMQINTKFMNHLQPVSSRFVTAAKQARNLHVVNFDQLYAFLKYNKKYAKEVRERRQRFSDSLALLANTYNPPPSYISQRLQYHSQPPEVYQSYQSYQPTTLVTQQIIQLPPQQSYKPHVVPQ